MGKHGKRRGSKPHLLTANDVAAVDEAEAQAGLNHHELPHYKSQGHRQYEGLQHVDEHGQHELNHHALPPPSPRAGKRKGAALAEASEEDGAPASKRSKTSQIQAMDTEEPAAVQPGAADNLPAKAKRVPGKRGQAARKQKQEEQLPVQEEAEAVEAGAREQEGAEQEAPLPGEDGDIHEMVAKELGEYFQSAEGAGAFRLALGKYLMEHMLKEAQESQAAQQQKARRSQRRRGRRHHRCASIAAAADVELDTE